MVKKFEALRAKMNHGARARSARLAEEMLAVMDLPELHKAQGRAQGEPLEPPENSAPASGDPHVSLVRDYVEALGGRLELVAHLPNSERVVLKSLSSKH